MAAPITGAFATLPYRYDAFSVNEGMNYLFKKSIGYPNTLPQGPLYSELITQNNSFPFISQNKIYNQIIPESNLPFNNYILDPSFSNATFGFRSPTIRAQFTPDSNGKRYYSSNYPYIAYYSNILLSYVAEETGIIDDIPIYNRSQVVSYGHPLLVNAIPVTFAPYNNNFPGAYSVNLLTSNIGSQESINRDDGYWLVDTDSGILTLYDSNITTKFGGIYDSSGTFTGYRLPRISFYRYEGILASTNVANTQDF